jgi:hypothetical protein
LWRRLLRIGLLGLLRIGLLLLRILLLRVLRRLPCGILLLRVRGLARIRLSRWSLRFGLTAATGEHQPARERPGASSKGGSSKESVESHCRVYSLTSIACEKFAPFSA